MRYQSLIRVKATKSNRRGAMLVLFLVLFPILLLMVGFSVDYANMQRTRTELRRATDLATKAAALSLSQTSDEAIALQVAIDVAAENDVAGDPLQLTADDVVFGTSVQNGNGTYEFSPGGSPIDSVRIVGRRTDGSPNGPINMYFGALYNSPTFSPQLAATAAFVSTDVCLVLDRSGSMRRKVVNGSLADIQNRCASPDDKSRWAALEEAVNAFIDIMENSPANPKVSMVSFASETTSCDVSYEGAEVDVPLVGAAELSQIRTAMADRTTKPMVGNTDIALGIQVGQSVLTSSDARTSAYKFMIVMTDGGYTEDNPVPYAEIAAASDMRVYTITFSNSANQEDMISVAKAGNGLHYHAESTADLITVFEALAGSLTRVIE